MTKKFNNLLNQRIIKHSLKMVILSILALAISGGIILMTANQVMAQTDGDQGAARPWWDKAQQGGLDQVRKAYGGGTVPDDIRLTIANIIKIVLGFLGILAVVLIIYAGFRWMTAGGNEENVAMAKKILIAGVIGLVIILSAYVLANFVINQIYGATTGEPVIQ